MERQRPRVLLVAEAAHLGAMHEALAGRAELVTATSAQDALEKVWKQRVDVCVADLHIPGSSGVELVKTLRESQPNVGRVLVSPFADTAVLVQAINQGEIFRFVPRPFTATQLQAALDDYMHGRGSGSEPDLILVVDDTATGRTLVQELLASSGFRVATAPDGLTALAALRNRDIAVAIVDFEMPEMTGLEVIMQGRQIAPEVPFLMLSAHVQHQIALDCMASGAFDFIPKPFSRDVLLFRVKRALTERRKADELLALRAASASQSRLIASSGAMRDVVAKISSFAASEETVLITGETGSGKEAVAREIHRLSRRSSEHFFAVNCGALTETLLESELFGHEKGAFTGAVARRKGVFELAHGGTLFLDELGEMSTSTQVKLLRVLEERQFMRVGGTQPVHVDVRLIAATNSELKQRVEEKSFRADLYYRLMVLPLHLPPLRERREDVPSLIQAALERAAPGRSIALSPEALAEALGHRWPGNVRELINTIARAVTLAQGDRIRTLSLDTSSVSKDSKQATVPLLRAHMATAERLYLEDLLTRTNGNLSEAAELAGVDRKSIYNKMKAHGLNREGFK